MDTIPELAKQVEFGGYDVLKVTGIAHAVWPCPCCAKACRFLCARRDRASQKKKGDKERERERERELPLSHAPRSKPMSVLERWEAVVWMGLLSGSAEGER